MRMQLTSAFALVLLASAACASGAASKTVATIDLELKEAATQKTVKASDYKGRVLLVDIWATWCVPCLDSMPFYADLYRRYEANGFSILAVSVDEREEDLARFLEKHALPFPVLRDPTGSLPARLDVRVMPTSYLLDREGRVINVHAGFLPGDGEQIEALIRRAVQ
jgi:thiol-disulfide isomerase/thioredoxin